MDHGKSRVFARLGCVLGVALYCFIGLIGSAHAALDSAGNTLNKIFWLGDYGIWNKAVDACRSYKGSYPAAATATINFDAANGQRFQCLWGTPAAYQVNVNLSGVCSDGTRKFSTVTGVSQCPEDAPPPPTCTAGTVETVSFVSATVKGTGVNAVYSNKVGLPTSSAGCGAAVSKVIKCESDASLGGASRPVVCTVEMTLDGSLAPAGGVASTTPPANSAPEAAIADVAAGKACPAGTVQTGMSGDGSVSCAGSGTSPTTAPTTETKTPPVTTSNPDGSTTTTTSTGNKNSDGSTTTTTTTTTTGVGGGTVSSTTTSTSAATGGGPGTQDKPADDFCKKNANLAVCRDSSVSGACGSIQCKGDAIQCAMYVANVNHMCALAADPAVIEGNRMSSTSLAGGTPDDIKGTNKDGKQDTDIGKAYDAAIISAGTKLPMFQGGNANSCPAPMQLQIPLTQSAVNMPFDTLCGIAAAMRGFVILAAGLTAMRIMFRNAS